MFEPVEYDVSDVGGATIKVIGVGGAGGNAINYMIENMINYNGEANNAPFGDNILNFPEVDDGTYGRVIFYAVNTDAKDLRQSKAQHTIQIGENITKGLGAGANPNIGRQAAEEDQDAIRSMLEGADMVFIAAGMGGGTGTGASPVIAQIAKELGILTVAVVTKPFAFERGRRIQFAEIGINELSKHVDSLIVIPNENLVRVCGKNITLQSAFAAANDVLRNAVMGISDMITSPGLIAVDFADVKTVMLGMGRAMMGSGVAEGEAGSGRAEKAAQEAIASPLLEDVDLSGAKGIIVNVTSGFDLTLDEFTIIGNTVGSFADDEATVVIGTALMPEMTNEIRVTVVATGLGSNHSSQNMRFAPKMPPLEESSYGKSETQGNIKQDKPLQSGANVYKPSEQSQTQPDRPTNLGNRNINIFDTPSFMRNKEQDNKQ
ncbi:cell division protein FtsZ [Avibacterium avium]|uniref:Cell division protein FtsZ n=1 Tax=Avibacterium avium TaxID=751 RepID=A0A379ATK1_AVIAV|nr:MULTISPECIES: cell division protein FtsZ [Avibacterium]MCW9715243.1 cell division protein FtsZ [Avibacterium sp. 21-594]SUB24909.1 protein FtsZ [Avibacterium avium]